MGLLRVASPDVVIRTYTESQKSMKNKVDAAKLEAVIRRYPVTLTQ